MEDDGFKMVKRTKKKNAYEEFDEDSPAFLEKAERKLRNAKTTIGTTPQFDNCIEIINKGVVLLEDQKIQDIICYGLGNFTKSLNSLDQYAMALEISEYYESSLYLYDPIFTPNEEQIMGKMGSMLIPENENGSRVVPHTTMFYLPHCPWEIFNNILKANWGQRLSNVVILGNNFQTILDAIPEKMVKKNYQYISEAIKFAVIFELENVYHFDNVFNDMAVVVFPESKLLGIPESLSSL